MTSKQRAYLKSLAMTMDPIFQIGKSSLTPENTAAIQLKMFRFNLTANNDISIVRHVQYGSKIGKQIKIPLFKTGFRCKG